MTKLSLWIQLRMWKDYLLYVILLQKKESLHLGIGLFLFLTSIYFLKQDLFSGVSTLSIVLGLIIFQFLWDMYNTKQEIDTYFNIQHSILRNPSNIADLHPSPKERAMGFEALSADNKKKERVFVSHNVNRYIQTTPLTVTLSPKKKKKIRQYLEKYQEILLQYLNYYFFASLKNHKEFINEEKLCLSADINLHSHTVVCHTNGYYDSFLTNQISGTTLVIQDKKHTTITTEEIFPITTDEENHICLTDISSSPMNHHIGCSTVGFTKDHKIILWIQGQTNQINNGLLVTTGSGSANASDLAQNDFQKSITRAMERELEEESIPHKKQTATYHTMILGFYRWVSRGGKPEFVGITKLPENADYYHPNTKEVLRKKANNYIFEIQTLDRLPDVLMKIRKSHQLSVPLFMCLYELEYMYNNHKEELQEFLFKIS